MEINYLEMTTAQVLKEIFARRKARIREKSTFTLTQFQEYVLSEESQFNTPKGWQAIRDAWYNKKPNIRLNELIDQYLFEIESERILG